MQRRGRTFRRLVVSVGVVAGLMVLADRWRPDATAGDDRRPSDSRRVASGPVPPQPREIADRVVRSVPSHVALDRFALTPHHAVLGGHAGSLDGVADLLERLPRFPGLEEPHLRRATLAEGGYDYAVVVPVSPPEREIVSRESTEWPPYAKPRVTRWLWRQLLPPST